MTKVQIEPQDLTVHDAKITNDQATALINSAMAQARYYAPCIDSIDFAHDDYAKSLIVDAILDRASKGDVRTATTGPMTKTVDTRTRSPRRPGDRILSTATVNELRQLCGQRSAAGLPRGSFPPAPRDLFGRL